MTKQCPTCGSDQLERIGGAPSPTCGECGLVISDDVDPPEPISDDSERQVVETWNEYYSVKNSTEQQIAKGLDDLDSLRIELRLPREATVEAVDVFGDASVETLAKGRAMKTIVAGSVCIGARRAETPRPVGTIAETADVDTDKLEHTVRLLYRILDREYAPVAPHTYIEYLYNELELDELDKECATEMVRAYEEGYAVSGKDPVGIAAAGLYKVANQQLTQREIADVAEITQETIRVRLNELSNIKVGRE